MTNSDLDKRLSAYLDGVLAEAKRERLERDLGRDAALRKQLDRSRALSSLVREAWTEGPAAPPPEVLIAALRPHLAAISRERRARPAWQQALEHARLRLSGWFGPAPLATSAIAAFLLAIAFLPRSPGPIPEMSAVMPSGSSVRALEPSLGSSAPRVRTPAPQVLFAPASLAPESAAGVYDVSPGERPAMIFQSDDGSTVLWLLESDDISHLLERMDRWG